MSCQRTAPVWLLSGHAECSPDFTQRQSCRAGVPHGVVVAVACIVETVARDLEFAASGAAEEVGKVWVRAVMQTGRLRDG